uniref:Putative DNA polymerase I n=1 Tax=Tydemania expeditionis TaxID=325645 RepID=A0A0D6E291_TYDEX|nr:putative DNA polymerase I [Tydemania expeditionis]CEO91115.1 putative DNA polymerase I [Tydemania expeditionis]
MCKSQTTLSAWAIQYTADPLFQHPEIVQWFTQFFALAQVESFEKFFRTLKTHIYLDKIYPLWDLMGADTGRITHSTPRDSSARSILVPSQPGSVFVIAYYKTIELVIQAILAKETTMISIFQDGLDLHMFLASKILGRSYEELMELKKTNFKTFKQIRNSMKPVVWAPEPCGNVFYP